MGFDFSADPDLLKDADRRKRPVLRKKFTLSSAQYDALIQVAEDGIAAGSRATAVLEKAALAVGQMKRQDERQKLKKGIE